MHIVICVNTQTATIDEIIGPFEGEQEAEEYAGNANEAMCEEDPSPDFIYRVRPILEPND